MGEVDFGGGGEIRFERQGKAGLVTLSRPQALNALTHGMVKALTRALEAWRTDSAVELVVVRAEGRAFCAGGDIVDVYKAGREGRLLTDFFADEYRLNAMIESYPKPYIALLSGIAMGGGVGIAYHGSHRIVSENAVFAMPEVGIGFFPDVGGSHLLPKLRGAAGLYLALTGNRIRWGDQLRIGLATHAVGTADMDALTGRLCQAGATDAVLATFAQRPQPETASAVWEDVGKHFSHASLSAIVKSLEEAASNDEFAALTLETMLKRSPTSLNIAFRQLKAGAGKSMAECMNMEFRILNRMLAGKDFYEGIRAVVIDKDNSPAWQPPALGNVDPSDIDRYFAPLGDAELGL